MRKEIDLHLHTVVSDGEMFPDQIIEIAHKLQLQKISITDHDAVGAYFNFEGDIFKKAESLGLLLLPGIELDCRYCGEEVHILGYEIDLLNKNLNKYLKNTNELRKQIIREQIEKINQYYKKEIIFEDEIFLTYRDTVMKPHMIHLMLRKKLFSEYREAARWVSTNIKTSTIVPKPDIKEIIQLIKAAGGHPVLSHAGYLIAEKGFSINEMIKDLLDDGLEGIEVEYPYYKTSPEFQTKEAEREMKSLLKRVADKYNLTLTRGSDAHTPEQMQAFNS